MVTDTENPTVLKIIRNVIVSSEKKCFYPEEILSYPLLPSPPLIFTATSVFGVNSSFCLEVYARRPSPSGQAVWHGGLTMARLCPSDQAPLGKLFSISQPWLPYLELHEGSKLLSSKSPSAATIQGLRGGAKSRFTGLKSLSYPGAHSDQRGPSAFSALISMLWLC